MPIINEKKNIIEADSYNLEFSKDGLFVYVKDKSDEVLGQLFLFSSIHSSSGMDDTTQIGAWEYEKSEDEIIASCSVASSIWTQKKYWLRCLPNRFYYGIEIEGKGLISDAVYFGGYCSGVERWGSGYFISGQNFKQGWTPEPNTRERIYFSPEGSESIDLNGVPIPGRDGWFFTPPPFYYSFEGNDHWLGVGICCDPGENRFVEYRYQGGDQKFSLALTYEEHTLVKGKYKLPEIGFYFSNDPYEGLNDYILDIQHRELVPAGHHKEKNAWWYQPMFCGWGSQCYLAAVENAHAPDYATQDNYIKFTGELQDRKIKVGTLVIDDKWQKAYGLNSVDEEKWPDLAGFIRNRHENGQKVLLWLKFWDPEGLPISECITNKAGKSLSVDPSNPKYEKRFREQIRYMLSEEGLNADGFKIDFSARIPSGPGIKTYGDSWGLELMKQYFSILHDESKKVKADALIIAHAPNPYLIDLIDMIRLNDINPGKDLLSSMRHRQKVATIAMKDILIDTDNWQMANKSDWLDYLRIQPELGVPALYYSSHIDRTQEPLTEEDFHLLHEIWEKYQQKVRNHE
jgi:hypothetical protein